MFLTNYLQVTEMQNIECLLLKGLNKNNENKIHSRMPMRNTSESFVYFIATNADKNLSDI